MKSTKTSEKSDGKKLTLTRDTVALLHVRSAVAAGGYSLHGKLSGRTFCSACPK